VAPFAFVLFDLYFLPGPGPPTSLIRHCSMLPTSKVRRYLGLVLLFYIHGRESQQELTSFDLKSTAFPYDMIYRLIIHDTYTDWAPDDLKSFYMSSNRDLATHNSWYCSHKAPLLRLSNKPWFDRENRSV
jgi:hypothetical protein